MSQSRTALLSSAITFLRDPTTAASPLAQRVAFLESKGLTPPEIEQALSAASSNTPPAFYASNGRASGRGRAHEEFERDWRDWFIMSVVGGAVGYVAVKLAQKFLVPHLQPPSSTELESAQAALEAKYDEAAALLQSLQTSTDALAASFDEQKEAVDAELEEVRKAVKEMRDGEAKREEWAQKVEGQVDDVVRGLPVMLEKQAASQAQSLTDLQSELKSLKSLLIARRPATPSFGSSPDTAVSGRVTPGYTPRTPGIPAWQLASKEKEKEKEKEEDTSASGVLVEKEDAPIANASSSSAAGSSATVVPGVSEEVTPASSS